MAFTLSLCTKNLTLAIGDCEENIRIGPLEVYLKWSLLAVSWRGTLQVIQDEAQRLRARFVEDRDARSDTLRLMSRGRKRRKSPRPAKPSADPRNG